MHHDMTFGQVIRFNRLFIYPSTSLRAFAKRIGISSTYLSKIERDEFPPPREEIILQLAKELLFNSDILLAKAGRFPSELLQIYIDKPLRAAKVLRNL